MLIHAVSMLGLCAGRPLTNKRRTTPVMYIAAAVLLENICDKPYPNQQYMG